MKVKAFQCSTLKQFYVFLSEIQCRNEMTRYIHLWTWDRTVTCSRIYLQLSFTENPYQCSSSHDAYNPISHVRWRRKHADIGEPLSALLGLWEVSVGLLKCNQPRGCASDEWLKMLLLEIVLGVKKSWCFSHCLSRFDRERSNDEVLFFDCFCSIASKIEVSFVQMC